MCTYNFANVFHDFFLPIKIKKSKQSYKVLQQTHKIFKKR